MNPKGENGAQLAPDYLGETLKRLLEERDVILAHLARADKAIEALRMARPEDVEANLPSPAKPREFERLKLTDAFRTYLRDRRGHKIPLNKAIEDLFIGKSDRGAERRGVTDPKRLLTWNIKILLSNNPTYVSRSPEGLLGRVDPRDITVWLSEDAEQSPKKRSRAKLQERPTRVGKHSRRG